MGKGDDVDYNIFKIKEFLIESEFGSEDYHLAYKTLMTLLKEEVDQIWEQFKKYYTNKQELAFLTVIDRLIYVDEDDPDMGESAEVVAKFLKADSQLLEYCKWQIDVENSYEFKVQRRIQIPCKLELLREAVRLASL